MPQAKATSPRGLSLGDVVGALGGGLLRVAVEAPGPEVDDITLAEPGAGVFGQTGDLLLGVGIESPEAAIGLIEAAHGVGSGGVVVRRSLARSSPSAGTKKGSLERARRRNTPRPRKLVRIASGTFRPTIVDSRTGSATSCRDE